VRSGILALGSALAAGLILATVASAAPSSAGSTGVGSVFVSNPVQSLGDESLTDQKDSDAAVPAAAYYDVGLTHLDGSGYLRGDYADIYSSTGNLAYSPNEHVPLHAPRGRVRAGHGVLLDHAGTDVYPQPRLR
jgi:hypothetical protein